MINRKVYQCRYFTIYTSAVGTDQFYLIASVKDKDANPALVCREIYGQIADIIHNTGIKIIQEKIFGSTCIREEILRTRESVLRGRNVYEELPLTYIQGRPIWGTGFSGLQIFAVKSKLLQNKVFTIYEDNIPCGRGISRDGTTILSLQNIHGFATKKSCSNNRAEQVARMFDKTNELLRKYGAVYQDVVNTRIYISNILDWYSEFNRVRNAKYTEYGILPAKQNGAIVEQIYLPSSTGIQADNPVGAEVVMNVLAIVKGNNNSVEIIHNNGIKQKSAYRYGSAFSRSAIIRDPNIKCILLSGTAAIDEQGKSLYPGNAREQMRKTFEIVEALVGKEGASLNDICHATIFLKRSEDLPVYEEVAKEYGLTDMPAVRVVADVCRDELLFEMDAVIAMWNTN
jgi:enamine deaminase RidA (YjgF/YER057c/UK114 family)